MCIGPLQTWGRRELCMKENKIMWMLELCMRLIWLNCSHACGSVVCLQNSGSGGTGR